MLKHIVMWKLKDYAEGRSRAENIEYIKSMLEALPGVIKELKFIEVGAAVNADRNYDAVLYSEFESPEALQIYLNHPEHKKVSEYVAKVREARIAGDYII